jgi:hypothetical protein
MFAHMSLVVLYRQTGRGHIGVSGGRQIRCLHYKKVWKQVHDVYPSHFQPCSHLIVCGEDPFFIVSINLYSVCNLPFANILSLWWLPLYIIPFPTEVFIIEI